MGWVSIKHLERYCDFSEVTRFSCHNYSSEKAARKIPTFLKSPLAPKQPALCAGPAGIWRSSYSVFKTCQAVHKFYCGLRSIQDTHKKHISLSSLQEVTRCLPLPHLQYPKYQSGWMFFPEKLGHETMQRCHKLLHTDWTSTGIHQCSVVPTCPSNHERNTVSLLLDCYCGLNPI